MIDCFLQRTSHSLEYFIAHAIGFNSSSTAIPYPVIGATLDFNLPVQSSDTDPPEFTLSFSIMVAPPTVVTCQVDGTPLDVADLFREVTAGEYDPFITTSPATNVNVTLRTRQAGNYQCNVSVFRASMTADTIALSDVTTSTVSVTGQ